MIARKTTFAPMLAVAAFTAVVAVTPMRAEAIIGCRLGSPLCGGGDYPTVPEFGFVAGTVRSTGAARYDWCSRLEVTAKSGLLTEFQHCSGSLASCRTIEVPLYDHTRKVVATPLSAARDVWTFSLSIEPGEYVTLSARCDPKAGHKFKSKAPSGPTRLGSGFTLGLNEHQTRNFDVEVKSPPPVRKTVVLEPSETKTAWVGNQVCTDFGVSICGLVWPGRPPEGALWAGYWNIEGRNLDRNLYEAGIRFDLTSIAAEGNVVIDEARLKYSETTFSADGDGKLTSEPACAKVVSAALKNVRTRTFVPDVDLDIPFSPGNWTVTAQVIDWLVAPTHNFGFLLKGDNETFQRNRAACQATIQNPTLQVTYTVIPD